MVSPGAPAGTRQRIQTKGLFTAHRLERPLATRGGVQGHHWVVTDQPNLSTHVISPSLSPVKVGTGTVNPKDTAREVTRSPALGPEFQKARRRGAASLSGRAQPCAGTSGWAASSGFFSRGDLQDAPVSPDVTAGPRAEASDV